MSPFLSDPAMSAAFGITVKASVFLSLAAIVQALLYRRSSAAMRHMVWTLAIVGVLLLPILSMTLPEWAVVIRTAATTAEDAAPATHRVEEPAAAADPSASLAAGARSASVARTAATIDVRDAAAAGSAFPWAALVPGVYASGVLVMLIHLARQRWSVRRFAREATDVSDLEWTRLLNESAASVGVRRLVRLCRSRDRSMPMAFGTRRPTILIPAVADTWPEDRRRAVILHELAHVARHDCLTQSLAFAACAMYWFHPAAWWVARRLRIERELACDDRVIAAGAPAREYAGHLLEIAYTFGSHRAPVLAVSMARPGQLEGRLLAVLDGARKRSVPALRVRVAGAMMAASLVLPVAMATSTVVAEEPDAERAAATELASPPPQQDPVVARSLKPMDIPLMESARRLVHAAAALFVIPQDTLPGTWEVRPTGKEGTVHLRLTERNSSSGSNIDVQRLEGLRAAHLTGSGGPVQFRLRRDAGTLTFEGVFRSGVGAGTFSFTPDPNFPAELAKRGFARPTALEQYQMARHDVGYAFLDELNTQGYARPQTSELVRAGQHGVHATYLHDMGALGYRLGSLAPLIELRDHGVTPDYVRALADQGYKGLSADGLRQARDHGVSPEYAREMRQLGHGVPIDELVRARDHGVSVEFAREIAAFGYGKLPLDSLIRLRDHGVTPRYVQELKALGYDRLAMEDLVTLRDHGLTPDRIRVANARAGTRLPIDMLKSVAAGGFR